MSLLHCIYVLLLVFTYKAKYWPYSSIQPVVISGWVIVNFISFLAVTLNIADWADVVLKRQGAKAALVSPSNLVSFEIKTFSPSWI